MPVVEIGHSPLCPLKRCVLGVWKGPFVGARRTKTAEKPVKQGEVQQDLNWPHHRDWAQVGPKITILEKCHFHAGTCRGGPLDSNSWRLNTSKVIWHDWDSLSHPRHAVFGSLQFENHDAMQVHSLSDWKPRELRKVQNHEIRWVFFVNPLFTQIPGFLFKTTETTVSKRSCVDVRPTQLIVCARALSFRFLVHGVVDWRRCLQQRARHGTIRLAFLNSKNGLQWKREHNTVLGRVFFCVPV